MEADERTKGARKFQGVGRSAKVLGNYWGAIGTEIKKLKLENVFYTTKRKVSFRTYVCLSVCPDTIYFLISGVIFVPSISMISLGLGGCFKIISI